LFLVVGEEESGDGMNALLESRSFPWAVVAEPTNLVPCLSHYGYMEMAVRTFGTRRHASKAGRQYNSIFGMLNMLLTLGRFFEEKHPDSVLNIRDIHSSEAGFAVPGSCEAWVDLHVAPDCDPEEFSAKLESVVESSLEGGAATKFEIDFPTLAKGYSLNDSGLLPDLLRKSYEKLDLEWKPGAFESHSDANLLRQAGCDPIIIGPGQLAKAHTSDESIKFAQVKTAAAIYSTLLGAL
jgi:acetylornithine deacetylase